MPIPPHAIPALLHRRQQPLPFRHSDGFYRQFCRRFAHDTPPVLPAAYASCIPTCTNSPWPVPAYRSDRLRSRLHAHLSANIFRCRFLYVQPASTLFGRLITPRCHPGAGTLQHQPESTGVSGVSPRRDCQPIPTSRAARLSRRVGTAFYLRRPLPRAQPCQT